MTSNKGTERSCAWLSRLRLILLATNAVCFGAMLVLLATGRESGPLAVLAIGTGLSLFAGLAGALLASRRMQRKAVSFPGGSVGKEVLQRDP